MKIWNEFIVYHHSSAYKYQISDPSTVRIMFQLLLVFVAAGPLNAIPPAAITPAGPLDATIITPAGPCPRDPAVGDGVNEHPLSMPPVDPECMVECRDEKIESGKDKEEDSKLLCNFDCLTYKQFTEVTYFVMMYQGIHL